MAGGGSDWSVQATEGTAKKARGGVRGTMALHGVLNALQSTSSMGGSAGRAVGLASMGGAVRCVLGLGVSSKEPVLEEACRCRCAAKSEK